MNYFLYWMTFNIIFVFYFSIEKSAEQSIWVLGLLFILYYNIIFLKILKIKSNLNYFKSMSIKDFFIGYKIFFKYLNWTWNILSI